MITYDPIINTLVNNFDFIIYLLNRRTRPQDICLLKYKIVEKMCLAAKDKNALEQFNNYISKGPY